MAVQASISMKLDSILRISALVFLVGVLAPGCKKGPTTVTPLNKSGTGMVGDGGMRPEDPFGPGSGSSLAGGTLPQLDPISDTGWTPAGGEGISGLGDGGPIALTSDEIWGGKYVMDKDYFRGNTVYFDFDRFTIPASERVKVEEVALYLQNDADKSVLVEGHCDERGTEEYNRSLGEKRALALREFLINLGVQDHRIHTISYGEDMPAVEGFDESAYSKNRRGVFVLLKPR